MPYLIRPIDISDEKHLLDVNALLRRTFDCEIPDSKLFTTTQTNSAFDSLYLAAFDGDEIVGFNAFISHDLIFNGMYINCYQSCWIVTSEEHRGKGIFPSLVETAKQILSARGAAFIFCFPNENSQPILTGKLGFREIPSLKWQVPNIPFIRDQYLNDIDTEVSELSQNVIFQNGKQLVDLKRRIYADKLVCFDMDDSFVWGVERCGRKYGVSLHYFEIGGIYAAQSEHVKPLLRKLYENVTGVSYFQLTASAGSPFNVFFNNLKPAQTNNLIVFDLNFDTGNGTRFNFFGGVKDVF